VRAARQEADRLPGQRQPGTVVPADRSRTNYREVHPLIVSPSAPRDQASVPAHVEAVMSTRFR
jgi:hypothetical protein